MASNESGYTYAQPATNMEVLGAVVQIMATNPKSSEMFRRGVAMGLDNVYTADQFPDTRIPKMTMGRRSPVTSLVAAPAWEGSGITKFREHDLAFCLGAVIGAFVQRAHIDDDGMFSETLYMMTEQAIKQQGVQNV